MLFDLYQKAAHAMSSVCRTAAKEEELIRAQDKEKSLRLRMKDMEVSTPTFGSPCHAKRWKKIEE
eukprot:scaffold52432_cov17-Tisochrysis_lutea.AAC.1